MRLAIIRARYNPFGGAERFVELALRALRDDGADVTVIARDWRDHSAADDLSGNGIKFFKVDPFYLGSTWRDWSFARGVQRVLVSRPVDLAQSHERIVGIDIYRAGDGVHASWLERRARTVSVASRLGIKLNWHHRYLLHTEKKMFADRRLRAIICNSNLVRDEIAERFKVAPERLHVIYNGVDLNRYEPQLAREQRDTMRAGLGIAATQPVLLFIGSGFARKGLADALAAVAEMREVHLVVVGYDKHAARYLAKARSLGIETRCHFVGSVNDARPWYGLADGLVLPTVYDPFPNVALEALACGLPILVSDGCGAREIVLEGQNGFVVPVGNVPRLVRAIGQWLIEVADPVRSETIARAARASALPFDVAEMSRRLLALYRSLLDESAA
jgi:UDP-glucose:(heptosyl)LPS alpha-1,3-glucosyltransferase